MVTVSVIVPVYNTEAYLNRCLDSILNQTFHDFELIIVDDGSSDNSLAICEEYARSDNRIVLIHKENGGLASARQAGLNKAKGKYSMQIDSDDWIELDTIEKMILTAENEGADIVICDMSIDYKKYNVKLDRKPKSFDYDSIIHYVLCDGGGNLANKLIRTSCYHQPVESSWIIGVNVFEDMIMLAKILRCPRKISHTPYALYHYNQTNMGSYMRSSHMYKHREKLMEILKGIIDFSKYPIEVSYLEKRLAYTAIIEKALDPEEFRLRFNNLKDSLDRNDFLLKYALNGNFYISQFIVVTFNKIKNLIKQIVR